MNLHNLNVISELFRTYHRVNTHGLNTPWFLAKQIGIFQDIRFFLQPELAPEIVNALRQSITALGGEVVSELPEKGYILADPRTPEIDQLLQFFGPERWVVPLSYVDACQSAGVRIPPVFLEGNSPMPIHIHESIANPKFRETLYAKILHCAGYPYSSIENARVVIADPKTGVFNSLVKIYQLTPHKYIESLDWVDKCIERQEVSFTPHVFKNPGGRRAGEERTQFTADDEKKLCEWIAAKIPYKSTGGRTGNKLYQQLCEMSGQNEYQWVARHTWQSWRERYKKNSERLDKTIDSIVATTKPNPGEKWQYGYVRQSEEKPKKKRKRNPKLEDETPDQSPQSHEFVVGSSNVGKEVIHMEPAAQLAQVMSSSSLGELAGMLQLSADGPAMTPGNEHDGEWSIRIGNDMPPAWAKRKAVEDGQDPKATQPGDPPPMSEDTLQLALTVAVAEHVIDQGLGNIARETRFTIEEVREYYDKCGDMERTSRRFQKLREHINLMPDEE